LEIIAVPSQCCAGSRRRHVRVVSREGEWSVCARRGRGRLAGIPSAMGNSKRSNRNSPACGLGSRTAGVVSISRRPRQAQRVHRRRNQGTFGRATEPTSRPILSARPSIGTPLEAEDAMDLARLIRVSFFEGMPPWGLVHLAEAATEERRPAGGMVLHQSDRPRAVHFLVAGSVQVLLRPGRPAGGSGPGRWLGDRRPAAGCRQSRGRRLRAPR
jgi:hypothetical protein